MVKLYVNLINKGMKTIDDVPDKWKTEVEVELAKK